MLLWELLVAIKNKVFPYREARKWSKYKITKTLSGFDLYLYSDALDAIGDDDPYLLRETNLKDMNEVNKFISVLEKKPIYVDGE